MSQKFFYQVIKNNHILATRTSPRVYTHAVVQWYTHREIDGVVHKCEPYIDRFTQYCGSLALASKKCRLPGQEIIELTVTVKGKK